MFLLDSGKAWASIRAVLTTRAIPIFALLLLSGVVSAAQRPLAAPGMRMATERGSLSDLEVTGLIRGLPPGARRYVTYEQLLRLSSVSVMVTHDENFAEMHVPAARVSGVPLASLVEALGVLEESDLVSAACADGYEAHYTRESIAAHAPILALKLDGLPLAEWSRKKGRFDVSPYMITYEHFVPTSALGPQHDLMQNPSSVVRLEFTTQKRVYGAIAPRVSGRPSQEQLAGFDLARQNCLRCHHMHGVGGVKAPRSWQLLSRFATDDPVTFAAYVHNPRSINPRATMPPNLDYDGPTLAALIAYFKTFSQD